MKDSSILFLDVRGRSELSGGRLKSASFMNIPHTALSNEFKIDARAFERKYGRHKPAPNDEIIVYCQRGVRGNIAKETLEALGYTNVTNLEGGYLNLEGF
ncbi:Oidioi.mRNA.OKI2018_I69.PAR.g8756.t1.cds [Oikopleura dioica]|uniref:Oidioi.mRNA.OKI2018_I69.PAR.g8756.t1.cds n=1 Tax=Oikopleura dioica TaxID=34765 RepID=A0ABN7RHF5_OIKDI|nr:Oidioi.mRNA.OKI2018_I69.PAR.g8756.t1.cds [Oikopleura dioica]